MAKAPRVGRPRDVLGVGPVPGGAARVDVGDRARGVAILGDVADDSNDPEWNAVPLEHPERSSDEVLVWCMDFDETLVHNRRARGLEVRLQSRAPLAGDERCPDGAKVASADHSGADGHGPVRVRARQALDVGLIAQRRAGCGQEVGQPGSLDVRQLLEPRDEPLLELAHMPAILGPRRSNMEGDGARRIDAGIDMREVVVAAQEQRRRSDEQHAQRDLCDDEEALDAMLTTGDATAPCGDHAVELRPRTGEGRHHAEDARREHARERR